MLKGIVSALIGGIIGAIFLSIIFGQIQWGALIGLFIGISISESIRARKADNGEVETDERIENNARKFMASTFSLSNFLLLIYLVIHEYVLNQDAIEVRYLILYLLVTFFICFFIGPLILKRR